MGQDDIDPKCCPGCAYEGIRLPTGIYRCDNEDCRVHFCYDNKKAKK